MKRKTCLPPKRQNPQDSNNKIPYLKWAKRLKEFIEVKGEEGVNLVKAMEWGVSMGRETPITDDMLKQRFPTGLTNNSVKHLMLAMRNWTTGMAEDVITYGVNNGVDA